MPAFRKIAAKLHSGRNQNKNTSPTPYSRKGAKRRRSSSPPHPIIPKIITPSLAFLPNVVSSVKNTDIINIENINRVLAHALAPGTITNYSSAVQQYLIYCDEQQFHISLRFPANELVLCSFAASLASKLAGSTIVGILSGLKTWHAMHNRQWLGGDRLLLIQRAAKRLTPASSKLPPRPPVTLQMLKLLNLHLDHKDNRDIAILAAALIAFWGQCRLGELLGSSRLKHLGHDFPSRTSLGPTFSSNGSRELSLPKTKTSQIAGETVLLLRQRELDPIQAIEQHLSLDRLIPASHHLFAFKLPDRSVIHCLTKESFLTRCNEIWSNHNIGRITGHSFRIGGTTELLKSGVAPEVVQKMGRWSSDAFLRYWRDLKDIATTHAENLVTSNISSKANAPPPLRSRPSRAKRTQTASRG